VLWIVISRFYAILSEDKYRTITQFVSDGILELGQAIKDVLS